MAQGRVGLENPTLAGAAGGLHISIVARALSHRFGGVPEYVGGLIGELIGLGTPHRFTIYYSDYRLIGRFPGATEVAIAAPHKLLWDHWLLPLRLRQDRPDVAWFPQNTISLGVNCPTVVSVTDLLYFPVPEVPRREYALADTLYARIAMPRSLHQATRIMAISDHTAYDIRRLIGVEAAKIRTIHLAPATRYRRLTAAECAPTRQKYNLRRPFFFYAGTLSPRKNVRVLVDAFGRIAGELEHDLVLTGGPISPEVPFADLVERYGIQGRVHRLGKVDADELVALYNLADAFVFPSLYEGFGLPPLEAFACGCPVISSAATSLREVVGDAALIFTPHDSDTLAAHMRAVVTDRTLRERLVRAGLERVKGFSYRRAARELLTLLEEAAQWPTLTTSRPRR